MALKPTYKPKTNLANGKFSQGLNSIFQVPAKINAQVAKFFGINNAGSAVDIVVKHANTTLKLNIAPGYSIDFLDPEEFWEMKEGQFIAASCNVIGAFDFYIEGTLNNEAV